MPPDESVVTPVIEVSEVKDKPKAKLLFSPLVQDFKPRCDLVEFPSPELPCWSDEGERKEGQWAFTTDGQLRDSTGAAWEVADEILRLQGGLSKPPLAAPLAPTAQSWWPSPLRSVAHSSAPYHLLYDGEEYIQRAYCAGKLGEPDDSFPFRAFTTWRQRGLIDSLPPPPVGLGHRRSRSGSQGSDSSFSSGASVSYMQVQTGVDGTPLDSPRAAFANFEAIQAIHSQQSSASSPRPGLEQSVPIAQPAPEQIATVALATEDGHLIPRYEQQYLNVQCHAPRGVKSGLSEMAALLHLANSTSCGSEMLIRLAMLQQGLLEGVEEPLQWNRRLSLYKTELCRGWQERGSCKYGQKCQFAHGPQELRPSPKRMRQRCTLSNRSLAQNHYTDRTEPCRAFESTGACPYGTRCIYKHDTENSNSGGSSDSHSRSSTPVTTFQPVDLASKPSSFGSTVSSYLAAPTLPKSPALETQEELLQHRPVSFSGTSLASVNQTDNDSNGGRLRAASENIAASNAWDSAPPNSSGVKIRVEPPTCRGDSPMPGLSSTPQSRLELLCATPAQSLPAPVRRTRSQGLLADLQEDDDAAPWPTEFCHPSTSSTGSRCRSVSARPVLLSPDSLWAPVNVLGVSFDPAPCARRASSGPGPTTAA